MIDIRKAFTDHHIKFVEQGHNVAKGNINIKCPICSEDPSEHMGINLTTGKWGCWRDSKHRGKNLHRLLALLDIYVSEERSGILQQLASRTFFSITETTKAVPIAHQALALPDTFVSIAEDTIYAKPFLKYLSDRGFDDPINLAKRYDLKRSTIADKWAGRIIIPIWIDKYVCWTGRTIGNNSLRYLSPKAEETLNIKDCIFNYNKLLKGGDTLVITEGPFDALKIDWYTEETVKATCLFGLSFKQEQLQLLDNICTRFNNILIGLDQGALVQSMQLVKILRKYSPSILKLPKKDFGEMSEIEILNVIFPVEENLDM
jgi:hypothetical protein